MMKGGWEDDEEEEEDVVEGCQPEKWEPEETSMTISIGMRFHCAFLF